MVARPLVYRAFPNFGATRQGAPGFPLIIHIGMNALTFTNESGEEWTCTANLGYTSDHMSTFALEPEERHQIAYANFQKPGYTVDIDVLRSEARDKIAMVCVEPSGRTLSYDFR